MNERSVAQTAPPTDARQESRHLLFLSHAGADAAAALKLADRIEATPEAGEHGLKVWVDKRDLEPGSGWQQQLEQAIEQSSTAFAVYLGATGIINWVDSEVRVALSRARKEGAYRFIPIISAGADGTGALPGFARQYQGVLDVENRPEELAKLIRAAIGAEARQPVQLVEQPFPGLRAFDEEQAHLFFGRETETEKLVEQLRREPLLMVVGDSGSGKSSLVRAGLVPRFRGGALADQSGDRPDDAIWHVVIARPRGRPFEALADAVFQSGEAAGVNIAKLGMCKDWIRTGRSEKIRDGLIHSAPQKGQILLVIDQFEELLTQAEEASRQPYIDALLGLVADPGDRTARIVMTMRYDYYNLCSQFPAFFDRLEGKEGRSKYPLERMEEAGLRACVQEPLKFAGVRETETLANEVVKDIGERAGNLALLQMALKEAWQKRRQFGDDLLEAYVRVGRVTGALANAANEVFENRLGDRDRQLAEIAFIRLVRLGDTGGTIRRVATRDEFSDDAWSVAQELATEENRRLLFVGGEPGGETVELAHEALATQWPRYQTWLQQAAGDKRCLDRLIERVGRWQATGAKGADLASGTEREEFQNLAQARPSWLAPAEHRFVKASAEAYQEEHDRKAEARLRELSLISWLKRAAIATAIVALVAISAGVFAWFQWDAAVEAQGSAVEAQNVALKRETEAQAARKEAQAGDSLYRAEQARQMLAESLPVTAMQLALAGLPEDPGDSSARAWVGETAGALVEALGAQRELTVLRGHDGGVLAAAFSPDGARIVSGSFSSYEDEDSTVRVWDAESGAELLVLSGHEDSVNAAAFSPDGARIVSGSEDDTVRVWDAASGAELLVFGGHQDGVNAAAFSPDGARIVSASGNYLSDADNTVRVWDAESGAELKVLRGHEGEVRAAAFSPDGARIVSGSEDGAVRLWDAVSGAELLILRSVDQPVNAVAFSPDGARIVSGADDRTMRVWDAATAPEVLVLRGHEGQVYAAAFSPDGARIVSGADDQTMRVWDAASGAELLGLRGHEGGVFAAAFSPNGAHIVSGSADGTVRVWDAASGAELLVLRGHEDRITAVGYSTDGAHIVSVADGTVRVWDAASGDEVMVRTYEPGPVSTEAGSPDGARIARGFDDGGLVVWDGVEQLDLRGHDDGVRAAAFSPDGVRIVSGSDDGTVRVWDAASGTELLVLRGHEGPVYAAAFSPDGVRIVSGGEDKTVRVTWIGRSKEELIAAARARLPRDLTADERRRFHLAVE